MRRRFVPAWSAMSQIQAFFQINAPCSLVVILPTFTPEQHMNPGDAVAHTRLGDLFNSRSNGAIIAWTLQFEIDNRAGG